MDRTFLTATVVFAGLAIAGVALTMFPADVVADTSAIRAVGPALLGGGLAAFLVEAFRFDRHARDLAVRDAHRPRGID